MSEEEEKIRAWLNEVFQSHNFDKFTFEIPNFNKNGGYAGEINFADILADKNGEQQIIRVIIKKNKEGHAVLDELDMREFYSNEVKFYSKIMPIYKNFAEEHRTVPFVYIPHCYGTIEKEDQYVIILENLKPKNFRTHELDQPLDIDHLKLVLRAYGEWHAFSLAFRDQKPRDFEVLGTKMKRTKCMDIFKNTVEHELGETIKLFTDTNKDQVIDKLKRLKDNFGKIFDDALQNKDECHLVLKHGDSWNNNFLFHYQEDKKKPDAVVIIDWQLCFLGSPLLDVTNFIFYCCSKKELMHMDELLKIYYRSLSKKIIDLGSDPQKIFPWEICQKSFLKYAPVSISAVPLILRLRYKVESDTQYDIADCVEDGNFSRLHGDGVRNPEKHFEDLAEILEYVIERKWI